MILQQQLNCIDEMKRNVVIPSRVMSAIRSGELAGILDIFITLMNE